MKCNFCDCPKAGFKGNASVYELLSEITTGIALSNITNGKRLNVHFARMGEPTFNLNVIKAIYIIGNYINETFDEFHPVISTMCPKNNKQFKSFIKQWVDLMNNNNWNGGCGLQFSINTLNENDRNGMFNNMSLSLEKIGNLIDELPVPKDRKYTLNFAVTSKSNLDVKLMNKYFDKNKCIIKITPIHETVEAVNNKYEIIKDFDVYSKFEEPLVKNGWDVIVFVPSQEEDSDRITCGNTLINSHNQ